MNRDLIRRNLLLSSTRFLEHERYWTGTLAADQGETSLLFDRPDPRPSGPRERLEIVIPPPLAAAIGCRGGRHPRDLYGWLVAALAGVLHRYLQTDDVTIVSPIDRTVASEETLGDRVFLRLRTRDETTCAQLVEAARTAIVEGYRNQDYPVREVVERIGKWDDRRRDSRLSNIICALEEVHDGTRLEPGGEGILFLFRRASPSGPVTGLVTWDPACYRGGYLGQVADHFVNMLHRLVDSPGAPIGTVPYLTPSETRLFARGYGAIERDYDREATVPALFERQADARGSHVAVVDDRRGMDYEELNDRANRLARTLRHEGVARNQLVGVLADRTVERLVDVLAILKAGGAYLPLDPGWPRGRFESIVRRAGLSLCIGSRAYRPAVEGLSSFLDVDDPRAYDVDGANLEPVNVATDRLYCLFTSGSTGTPKGVTVPHRALINRVSWIRHHYGLTGDDVAFHKTPFTFDVSVCELFRGILTGGKVCLLRPGAEWDQAAIVGTARRHGVTAIDIVPSLLEPLLDHLEAHGARSLSGVRWYFIGAEVLRPDLVRRFRETLGRANGSRLINLWGTTETTVDVSWYDCTDFDGVGPVPIGRPMQNTRLYVLDRRGNPQPMGVPGELCVDGDSLATGYLDDDVLTRERFADHPFRSGARMYRTGDIARWLPDGNLELIGRSDEQVKIRGMRVEPGEVEAALRGVPGIRDAAVTVIRDAPGAVGTEGPALVAYVIVEEGGTFDAAACRLRLREALPPQMVPAHLVRVARFPRMPGGKIDKGALPIPTGDDGAPPPGDRPARTAAERALVGIWGRVLGRAGIGVDDDFFDLGGHSLRAIELIFRIAKDLGVTIDLATLFEKPTIAGLAAHVDRARPTRFAPIPAVPPQSHHALSSGQTRIWIANLFKDKHTAYNVSGAYLVEGELCVEALGRSLAGVIRRHEVLRTTFRVVDGAPRQVVHDYPDALFPVETIEMPGRAPDDPEVRALVARAKETMLDLGRSPLVSVLHIRLGPGRHVLVIVTHHIAVDEWSMRILLREFGELYAASVAHREPRLEPVGVRYKDFAAWHNRLIGGSALDSQKDYWMRRFADIPPTVRIPQDYPTPKNRDFRVDSVFREADRATTALLGELAREEDATMFMLTLALFDALLHLATGRRDLVVGTTVAGRRHADLADLVGFLINTLALRTHVDGTATLRALIRDVRKVAIDAFDAQDYPFERLVEGLGPCSDQDPNPFFTIGFEYNSYEPPAADPQGLRLQPLDEAYTWLMFDLLVILREHDGRLGVSMNYSRELYRRETIERLADCFQALLRLGAARPDAAIGRVEAMDPDCVFRPSGRPSEELGPAGRPGRASTPGRGVPLAADFDFLPGGWAIDGHGAEGESREPREVANTRREPPYQGRSRP